MGRMVRDVLTVRVLCRTAAQLRRSATGRENADTRLPKRLRNPNLSATKVDISHAADGAHRRTIEPTMGRASIGGETLSLGDVTGDRHQGGVAAHLPATGSTSRAQAAPPKQWPTAKRVAV